MQYNDNAEEKTNYLTEENTEKEKIKKFWVHKILGTMCILFNTFPIFATTSTSITKAVTGFEMKKTQLSAGATCTFS